MEGSWLAEMANNYRDEIEHRPEKEIEYLEELARKNKERAKKYREERKRLREEKKSKK